MSPIRQQLIDAIAQTPDIALAETLQRLQTHAPALPTSTSTQAWTNLLHWLEHRTPEEEEVRSQAISDLFKSWEAEDDEPDHQETWEFLKTALDEDRLSDRCCYCLTTELSGERFYDSRNVYPTPRIV